MSNKYRVLIILSILFILIASTLYIVLSYEKDDKINGDMDSQVSRYIISYDLVYHQYKERANLIFDTKINKTNILEIFKDAYGANEEERKKLRSELLFVLKDDYTQYKNFFVKQLHFHLPNNDSFLRFHRPNKFGDNLTDARATVRYVNENKKFIEGFEEGKIYNGYRFVYPLFYENKHIGSVEISFDTSAILNEFMSHFNTPVEFLISKGVVEQKVMNDEKSNYIDSEFKGYYFEKSVHEKIVNDGIPLSNESIKIIEKKISLGEVFTRYDKETNTFVIVKPLKNPISKKVVAAIIFKGSSKYIENKTLNFHLATSTLIFLLGIIFTIIYFELTTKLKLKENSKKTQAVIEGADSGIAILDLDGKFLEVNYFYTKLLGYTQDEFKNLSCIDLTKDGDKDVAINAIKDAKKYGNVSKIRKTCIAKNNTKIHLEMSLNLLPNKKSFVAVTNSLEDKIELESALNRFEHIFNYTSVGFLIVDKNRDIIDVNQKFLDMFGYRTKNEVVNKNAIVTHLDEVHYLKFGKEVFSKVLSNEVRSVEFEFKKRDGSSIWCEVSGSPINDNKIDNGVLWAMIDSTEKVMAKRKILEQNDELQKLNENLNDEVNTQIEKLREKDTILNQKAKMASMGEMIDAVAHQWKQPLNIINLSTSELDYMIEDNKADTEYLKELSKRFKKQIKHMVETLDEFREFFKPKSNLEYVSVKRIIDSALVLMKDELVKHTIVTKFIGDEFIKVKVIPNEFKHVVINLVNNAKDEFVSKGLKNRTITFEVLKEELFIVLKVRDSAGGIPTHLIDDIFKANVTTKPEQEGSGIGLYMSKNILEKIGGSIEVSNIENGAEFIIRIPV